MFLCAYRRRRCLLLPAASLLLLAPLLASLLAAPPRPRASPPPDPDLPFFSELRAALLADADPFARALAARAALGVWPISFSRLSALFVPPPPPTLREALRPSALAALSRAKARPWSSIAPYKPYAFAAAASGEEAYNAEYRASWFAVTMRKAGWDCNRHLEILANGALPVFRNISATLAHGAQLAAYPKALLALVEREAGAWAGAPGGLPPLRRLAALRHYALRWAHAHLTARAGAAYMLRAAWHGAAARGAPPPPVPRRVAFIDASLPQMSDYLSQGVLFGLLELFGEGAVDVFYPVPYLYQGGPDTDAHGRALYGRGFGYAGKLPPPATPPRAFAAMVADLHAGRYDVAVWGSAIRSMDHLDGATAAAYAGQPERLWLCDGEDEAYNSWAEEGEGPWVSFGRNATVFVREF